MADEDEVSTGEDTGDSDELVAASDEAVKGMRKATADAQAAQKAILLAQAHQTADALPSTLPTQGGPQQPRQVPMPGPMASQQQSPRGAPAYEFGRGIGVLQPPAPGGAPPSPPAPIQPPRNRMYMGANVGPPDATPQQFFDARGQAPNTMVNQMPPPTPAQAAGAPGRVAAATSGVMNPGLTSNDEGSRKFAIMQMIQQKQDMGQPVPPEQIAALLGSGSPRPVPPPKRYNVPGVGLTDESGNVIKASVPKGFAPLRPPKPLTQTTTERFPAVKPEKGTPGTPASNGFFGWGAQPAVPPVPGTPGQPARTITRHTPMDQATETGTTPGAQPLVPPAGSVSAAPKNAKDRKTGTVYKTPKGNFKWTEDGWEAVE
ncbi:MAG TPA: hypothetical protein VMQ76_09650 [Terracidiphilus sp.]|nr:hypothetical protein [Terracidiphilus sp.]